MNESSGTPSKELDFQTDWTYSPAPESTDHIEFPEKNDLFINGKFQPPVNGKYFETLDPSNEEKLADVAEAGQEDIANAVAAAS